jgi:hypothetical protein
VTRRVRCPGRAGRQRERRSLVPRRPPSRRTLPVLATAACEILHGSCGFPQRSPARSLLERAGLAPEPSAQCVHAGR